MLAKRIIPCLDVDDGRVKKGVNFVNLVDVGSPVDIAASYEQQQADELVFLDITATVDARTTIAMWFKKSPHKYLCHSPWGVVSRVLKI